MANWDEMALVGRITRPHGLRGDVVIHPETDFVEERFRAGAIVWTSSDRGVEALVVHGMRGHVDRPVIAFEGFARIEEVERLVGLELRVPEDALLPLDAHTYYQHDLVGCVVDTTRGDRLGSVIRVDGTAACSQLVVQGGRGEVLIPLAAEICVTIDVEARAILIEPPEGLLELNDPKRRQASGG